MASSAPRYRGDATAPFILNMAQDLCDLGWHVDILAPHAAGLKKEEKIGAVTIYRFSYMWPAKLQTLCYNGGVAGNLKRSKWRFLQIPFFALSEALALLILLRREDYDIIHSHWLIPQGFIGQMIAGWKKLPHIVSVHGTDIYGFRHPLLTGIKKAAIKNSRLVIANSRATKDEILKITKDTNTDIAVIPTGTTPLQKGTKTNLNKNDFCKSEEKLLVFLGRLSEEKGLLYLIKALPEILNHRKVKLLVIGDGPERLKIEKHINDMGLSDTVIFTGTVPHENIYDHLLLGDIFIGPSITLKSGTTEAQGNTFVEAQFAGLPVIASNIGGIPDAVIHEQTGLLVPEKDPDAIAEAVLRLLENPELTKELAKNGRQHALKNFSRYANAEKIGKHYSVLSHP